MTTPDPWAELFPALFREEYVDYARARVHYRTGAPPEDSVSRLHLVALTDADEVVVCRSSQGWRFLPGGTREPGESLVDLARRELLEEAGAEVVGDLALFAAHVADSERETPYKPHLPHPRSHWAYAVARVRVVGAPTNPDDGEDVVEVLTLPVADAVAWLSEEDAVMADVVRHADALGAIGR